MESRWIDMITITQSSIALSWDTRDYMENRTYISTLFDVYSRSYVKRRWRCIRNEICLGKAKRTKNTTFLNIELKNYPNIYVTVYSSHLSSCVFLKFRLSSNRDHTLAVESTLFSVYAFDVLRVLIMTGFFQHSRTHSSRDSSDLSTVRLDGSLIRKCGSSIFSRISSQ